MATVHFSKDDIASLRKLLGMNQAEFAEHIGVQRTAVTHWESGARNPSGAAAKMIEMLRDRVRKNSRKK